MEHAATEVPLHLLDEPPEHVEGDNAFVLYQPTIGRIEVGRPLPRDEIWNHFTGDLRFTAVRDSAGGMCGGGGPIPEDGRLELLWSDGSGDDPDDGAWVIAGSIPSDYPNVVVQHSGARLGQRPIRGTIAVPFGPVVVTTFEILGIDSSGAETLLHRV